MYYKVEIAVADKKEAKEPMEIMKKQAEEKGTSLANEEIVVAKFLTIAMLRRIILEETK